MKGCKVFLEEECRAVDVRIRTWFGGGSMPKIIAGSSIDVADETMDDT